MPKSSDQISLPANRLRELRWAEDGSSFSRAAALVGKHQTTYHRYETGHTRIPDDVKLRLAEHYGVSISYLMGWDSEPALQR